MSKPMTEQQSRALIMEHARNNGYEQPILAIFQKVDAALKNAKTKEERDIIALQGLQEVDSYFRGGAANLDGVTVKGIGDEAIEKFNKR